MVAPWVEVDGVRREVPRIAGVSSFGAGGSNAHVVIEEYVPSSQAARAAVSAAHPALIVLSAKTADRLREQALQLVAALERRALGDADLADVAYTLQVGREAMESRLALTAGSLAELTSKLKGYLSGKSGIDGLYSGEAKREKDTLAAFAADEDMAQILDAWVAKGKYGKLLELWVKGLSFDWRRLYGEARPRRIPLPTYPFARERYWVEPARSGWRGGERLGRGDVASGVAAGCVRSVGASVWHAAEWAEGYLRVVPVRMPGSRVLPDVGHLELARAAVAAAAGFWRDGGGAGAGGVALSGGGWSGRARTAGGAVCGR